MIAFSKHQKYRHTCAQWCCAAVLYPTGARNPGSDVNRATGTDVDNNVTRNAPSEPGAACGHGPREVAAQPGCWEMPFVVDCCTQYSNSGDSSGPMSMRTTS